MSGLSVPPWSFEEACQAVLSYLGSVAPMGAWIITRVSGDDMVILGVDGESYGLLSGDVMNWGDSYCYYMVEEGAPPVAPDARLVSAYRGAGVNLQMTIGSYMGAPIYRPDGSIFGTICSIDPKAKSPDLGNSLPLLELLSRLLSAVLVSDFTKLGEVRRNFRTSGDWEIDAVTGLAKLEGFEKVLSWEVETRKSSTFTLGIGLIALVELNQTTAEDESLGDESVARASQLIAASIRGGDFLARISDSEFALLTVDLAEIELESVVDRISNALSAAGVRAIACHQPFSGSVEPAAIIAEAKRRLNSAMQLRRIG